MTKEIMKIRESTTEDIHLIQQVHKDAFAKLEGAAVNPPMCYLTSPCTAGQPSLNGILKK